MKRFLLLVVCVVAAFAAVPASAYDCLDSVDNGYLCAGDSGPFEFCTFSWTGSTVSTYQELCADTSNDAWSDAYASVYGPEHSSATYVYDDYVQTYANVLGVCLHAQYEVSSSYYNFGSC